MSPKPPNPPRRRGAGAPAGRGRGPRGCGGQPATHRMTAPHPVARTTLHPTPRLRIPSRTPGGRRGGAAPPGRGDCGAARAPSPRCPARREDALSAGRAEAEPPPPPPPAPRRSLALGTWRRDCPRAVSLRAPASVSLCLPGTLRGGRGGRIARTRARPSVAAGKGRASGRTSRRLRPRRSSASRRRVVGPAVRAGGRRAARSSPGPSPPSPRPPTAGPGEGGGRCLRRAASSPPPPRLPSPRARRRRRRCACCSSPSPLQCEGLEDGRLAELRG